METSTYVDASPQRDFQKLSQTIGSNIQKIIQNVSSMQKIVNQMKNSQDSQETRSQLSQNSSSQIQNYTEQLAKDTSGLLKTIMTMPLSSPDHRQNKLSRERLSEEFMSALNVFQTTQRMAAKIVSDDVKKAKSQNIYIGDPFAVGGQQNQLIEMEASNIRRQEQLQLQTEEEIRQLEGQVREVTQLENNIASVNDIFKEIAEAIHSQGEVVDSIEASIDRTSGYVESGTQQLHQASNSQNKLRKRKLYLLIVLLVIISIILIIIFAR